MGELALCGQWLEDRWDYLPHTLLWARACLLVGKLSGGLTEMPDTAGLDGHGGSPKCHLGRSLQLLSQGALASLLVVVIHFAVLSSGR